jgi:hypothetical protein
MGVVQASRDDQLTAMMQRAQEQMSEMRRQLSMAGRVLTQIDIAGMSDDQRDELLQRLPVKVGDTLTRNTIDGIQWKVHQFEELVEHLGFELVPLEDNSVVLKIAVPDFQRVVDLNRQIVQAEAQLAILLKTFSPQHPDVQAFKSKLDALKKQRDDLTK